jgi:hypothetical protein
MPVPTLEGEIIRETLLFQPADCRQCLYRLLGLGSLQLLFRPSRSQSPSISLSLSGKPANNHVDDLHQRHLLSLDPHRRRCLTVMAAALHHSPFDGYWHGLERLIRPNLRC